MSKANSSLHRIQPRTVGSFSGVLDLEKSNASSLLNLCDIAEIRLDLIHAEKPHPNASLWEHLEGFPLLFTARTIEEGGAISTHAETRMSLLRCTLDAATFIDIEVASISEMSELLDELTQRNIPWIASYHDFQKLPSNAALQHAVQKAKDAGAYAFKAAATLETLADLARLAEFQLEDHGLPVATMGMGPLAPVSRLLCAQCGSVLNYGYIGHSPTAPGQWDSSLLKLAISRLTQITSSNNF